MGDEYFIVKFLFCCEFKTHDFLTFVIKLQPVPFITIDLPSSDQVYSGTPSGHHSHQYDPKKLTQGLCLKKQ